MRNACLWLVVGMLLFAPGAHADEQNLFEEAPLEAGRGAVLSIPPGYGDLISVVESSEVHHLYFQDRSGVIRMILVGPRGAAQRAKHELQLLSNTVYTIER